MQEHSPNIHDIEEPEFSFKNILLNWINNIKFVLRQWKFLLIIGLIGAVIGFGYGLTKKNTYTANLTFIVEEAKPSGGSVLSALSGSLGFDVGGLNGGNGILSGDNVLQLVKSHSLIKKTLLTAYNDSGNYSLADKYADTYDLKTKWLNNKKIGQTINFNTDKNNFSRLDDSLLQTLIKRIDEEDIDISKPDKKLSFFQITVTMRDERLSKLFCERLLKTTTDFYIEAKTRRTRKNVERLQSRADSIGLLLNSKTFNATEADRLLLDANPIYSNPSVNAEISSREKGMLGSIYSEIVKNLEISKTALIQETPTVQIVDEPELPLKKNKMHVLITAFLGAVIAVCIGGLFLLYSKRK